MLSKEQKEKLRNIHMYEISYKEKNGIAIINKTVKKGPKSKETVTTVKQEFIVPSPYQITESIFKQILSSGFSKVERVSPSKANCIIRVFQKLHQKHEYDVIFNLYGANCFVKNGNAWISEGESRGNTFQLNYTENLIDQWLYQDEKVTIRTDFMDVYVKVS